MLWVTWRWFCVIWNSFLVCLYVIRYLHCARYFACLFYWTIVQNILTFVVIVSRIIILFLNFKLSSTKLYICSLGMVRKQPNNIHMRLLQPSYNGHLPHILWTSPLWTLPIKSRNKSFTWVLMVDHFTHTTPTPNIFNKFNNPKLLLNNLLFVLTIVSIHF